MPAAAAGVAAGAVESTAAAAGLAGLADLVLVVAAAAAVTVAAARSAFALGSASPPYYPASHESPAASDRTAAGHRREQGTWDLVLL